MEEGRGFPPLFLEEPPKFWWNSRWKTQKMAEIPFGRGQKSHLLERRGAAKSIPKQRQSLIVWPLKGALAISLPLVLMGGWGGGGGLLSTSYGPEPDELRAKSKKTCSLSHPGLIKGMKCRLSAFSELEVWLIAADVTFRFWEVQKEQEDTLWYRQVPRVPGKKCWKVKEIDASNSVRGEKSCCCHSGSIYASWLVADLSRWCFSHSPEQRSERCTLMWSIFPGIAFTTLQSKEEGKWEGRKEWQHKSPTIFYCH